MFRLHLNLFFSVCATLAAACQCDWVGAGDVTIRTDHPHYPGEGAFQTVDDCVAFATQGKSTPQDKAIAMYKWFLLHQWHLMSPMEWCVPGRIPDSADPGNYETVVFDANRARFSFGYGLCGTVHAWNEPYWKALGMPARRREFPSHVNSEIFYDGSWHAFDTDMAGLLFRPDGVVAGYDDIQRDAGLAESVRAPLPHYPFAWPSDFDTMKKGWQQVAKRKSWYPLYNGGYAAHPGIVSLRRGETFTRYYDRDHFGGPSKRRFWQNQKGGPQRYWTYFDNGEPVHDGATSNARSNAAYCNGEFVYEPGLTTPDVVNDPVTLSGRVSFRQKSPSMFSADGRKCQAVFRHYSPYVICGDPVDDANPMSGTATDGFLIQGRCHGTVMCDVSADQGQTWIRVPLQTPDAGTNGSSRSFRCDATEVVKGRYGWQVRLTWSGDDGVDALKFTTTTQVCQAMYPRLTENGCDVQFRSEARGVVALIPNFGLSESEVEVFEDTSLRSDNLQYQPRSRTSRLAYRATDAKPAHVVFKLSSPQDLQEIRAAVRYKLPVPPPKDCDFRLQVSLDGGDTWSEFAKAQIPPDNEFSSGWLSGTADVSSVQSKDALIRFHMHSPGKKAGLIDARLYGIYATQPARRVRLEFGWLEKGQLKTHSRLIDQKAAEILRVPTCSELQDRFVRLQAL